MTTFLHVVVYLLSPHDPRARLVRTNQREDPAVQRSAHVPAGPPPYRAIGRHGLSPDVQHDEAARFDFIANLNRYLAQQVLPGVRVAYERRAKPAFERQHGRPPQDRREVRELMARDPHYQSWSALRRAAMEQRQQAGRALVLRQLPDLVQRARRLNEGAATLKLDPTLPVPRYIAAVDQHCMPGGYAAELVPDDVSAAANYDAGLYATTGGALGRYSDGGGWAAVEFLERHSPGLRPRRILDLGAGLGHNTLPLAQAYPTAQVVAVDVAAPMLRYGHARARSLGIDNVEFVQANAESLPFPAADFDLIVSCMFLHETSRTAIRRIFAESHRLLAPGGLSIHLEQPQYHGMEVYEQFIRDWDAYHNNEPFWTTMHDLDLVELAVAAGFERERCFEGGAAAKIDESLFGPAPPPSAEDYGRKAAWYVFGAGK